MKALAEAVFPLLLVVLNAGVWLGIVATGDRLPPAYFESRDARVKRTANGVTFDVITDVDPQFILAERSIIGAFWSRPKATPVVAVLLNLPAAIVATLLTASGVEPALGGIGWRAQTWVDTAVFGVTSSLQWWGIAAALLAFRRWRRGRSAKG
jgi:hypothetical protein